MSGWESAGRLRRREFIALALAAAGAPATALAQVSRQRLVAALIGAPNPPDQTSMAWLAAVRAGLAGTGWAEGSNVHVEARFTAGEAALTARFSAELVAMQPDIFVTGTTENAVAISALAPDTPLVFVAVPDPIAAGLVDNYPHPNGRATGFAHLEPSVGGKMVDLLMEVAPRTSQVVFFTNPATSQAPSLWRPFVMAAAATHGIGFVESSVAALDEIEPAVARMAETPGSGIVLPANNWVHNNARSFVEPINRYRIPAVYPAVRMIEEGGLIGFGVDIVEMFRLGGEYAGRILNGLRPGDLPVQSADFGTAINLRTAAAQGIVIPSNLLVAADRIIE